MSNVYYNVIHFPSAAEEASLSAEANEVLKALNRAGLASFVDIVDQMARPLGRKRTAINLKARQVRQVLQELHQSRYIQVLQEVAPKTAISGGKRGH